MRLGVKSGKQQRKRRGEGQQRIQSWSENRVEEVGLAKAKGEGKKGMRFWDGMGASQGGRDARGLWEGPVAGCSSLRQRPEPLSTAGALLGGCC